MMIMEIDPDDEDEDGKVAHEELSAHLHKHGKCIKNEEPQNLALFKPSKWCGLNKCWLRKLTTCFAKAETGNDKMSGVQHQCLLHEDNALQVTLMLLHQVKVLGCELPLLSTLPLGPNMSCFLHPSLPSPEIPKTASAAWSAMLKVIDKLPEAEQIVR